MSKFEFSIIIILSGLIYISCGQRYYDESHFSMPNKMPNQVNKQISPSVLMPFDDNNSYILYNNNDNISITAIESVLGFKIDHNDDVNLLYESVSWLGVPYRHAHNDKNGTDCSGLTFSIYKNVYGIILDRSSDGQFYKNCKIISRNRIKQGDLLFFAINKENKISHVGMYLKDNKFIHASSVKGVVISDLNDTYYQKYFYAAGRVK